ncbi:MAG: nucleotidyl transferase AbiEii/AbiGii toxin family protein [Candidatus Obscuribacterales bacterium]|nr:nucleotidyl transferase AbiEii/AbiGii toxin family protein [Candidatus Obscuribacterales bacterium]
METVKDKYKTARAFRVAIADRLKNLSRETGESYLDLYRRVAIDRFLARIDWSKWIAKGGYAMQRRIPKARRTKDIDLATIDSSFHLPDSREQEKLLLEAFQEFARVDVDDYFEFQVTAEKYLPAFGLGGIRCQVRCLLDGESWSTFQLDAVIQQEKILRAESISGDSFLSFAGLEPLTIRVPKKEEVFAEKIHAYTFQHKSENTRVKDLVDMFLLIQDGLTATFANVAILEVFRVRQTHNRPSTLPSPPASWENIFKELAEDSGINLSMEKTYFEVAAFYCSLF